MSDLVKMLDEIEARANAATEGPWVHNGINGVHTRVGSCVATSHRHDDRERSADAEFIAHARTDLPRLIAAVRAVLDLHRPDDDSHRTYCVGCWEAGGQDGAPSWPCPTYVAITYTLGGAR